MDGQEAGQTGGAALEVVGVGGTALEVGPEVGNIDRKAEQKAGGRSARPEAGAGVQDHRPVA